MFRISKVKSKKGRVYIEFEDKEKDNQFTMNCKEKARPEFYQAFRDLRIHVRDICELPEKDLDRITVTGVSFNYGGPNETMGATLIATKVLDYSHQELNLITPNKASEMYNPEADLDEKQVFTEECVDCLKKLQEECDRYIRGDREQGNLFPDVTDSAEAVANELAEGQKMLNEGQAALPSSTQLH